jgi:hypothetical protein
MKTRTKLFWIFTFYFFLGGNLGGVIFAITIHLNLLNYILNIIAIIGLIISSFGIDWVTWPGNGYHFKWKNIYSFVIYFRNLKSKEYTLKQKFDCINKLRVALQEDEKEQRHNAFLCNQLYRLGIIQDNKIKYVLVIFPELHNIIIKYIKIYNSCMISAISCGEDYGTRYKLLDELEAQLKNK